MLGIKPNHVSGIIHKIRTASDSYLSVVTHPRPLAEGKKGHPLHFYHLNQLEFVTNPYTAVILLELSTFPEDTPLRISREKFSKHLVSSCKLEKTTVERRITWCIENSYIHANDQSTFLWPHERIDCEREYLELLVKSEYSH